MNIDRAKTSCKGRKAAFHTLGCKVNQYETEALIEKFQSAGFEIVSDEEFSDVYIINTCTVTNLADRKSRQFVRKVNRLNPNSLVVVTGCYAQMSPEEVKNIEGVDIVVGTNEKTNILHYVIEKIESQDTDEAEEGNDIHVLDYSQLGDYHSDGIITSMESRTRAFIKIQEGCNRFCSYCIIPYARGKVRSRDLDEIVTEAKKLIGEGFKEIVLTGINTALYGEDLEIGGIEPLISALDRLDGDFRIRLSSLEPTVINAEYVSRLLKYKRLCPHLHLSIQSGSDKVLSAMNRKYTRQEYLEIVKVLKKADPHYGITTDIIVGFPGEDEDDFEDSLKTMEEVGFCRVHGFKYSPRKGTKAAGMEYQIDGNTKNHRIEELIKIGDKVSKSFVESSIGKVRKVLFEQEAEDYITGYSDNYIKVYVKVHKNLLNNFAMVKILAPFRDGALGEIIGK